MTTARVKTRPQSFPYLSNFSCISLAMPRTIVSSLNVALFSCTRTFHASWKNMFAVGSAVATTTLAESYRSFRYVQTTSTFIRSSADAASLCSTVSCHQEIGLLC
ncbi:unnamed protein product [Musa textilis]